MNKGKVNIEILHILNYVFLNSKLPEITNDNCTYINELENNQCIYKGNILKTAITANPYDKSKSQEQERWLVNEDAANKIYGFTKKDIMEG